MNTIAKGERADFECEETKLVRQFDADVIADKVFRTVILLAGLSFRTRPSRC
jgi:hypothetical protein